MFRAEIIGNLGADASVMESNGSKFVTMRIAHTDAYKDEQGNKHEKTVWVDATMNDAESKLLPYLKQGVKVFVRGNASLRVYSSPKDRCMKAGVTLSVREIELVGGSSDDVPRQLIDPATGMLYESQKYYWINRDNKDMKKDDLMQLVDARGNQFVMNKAGFVSIPQTENVDQ
ncbi:MAG: single-stranded DNA-binding protein [Prevotella sp.]|nr:single-stranded DNA-binding protein [Prevotella sp.]